MEPGNRLNSDDELSAVLNEWHVETSLPPRFREAVWRRIAASKEAQSAWNRYWQSLFLRWELLVLKPVGVAACLALFTAAGVGLGAWHARELTAGAQSTWQAAYFQSVSPSTVALNR